jgi:methylenetetrahydrofolate dehydrogenase (NADP+) / methenyltetrahydrofolate cyclohydrolase
MMNKIIDGRQIAREILDNLKREIIEKIGKNKIGLAFILIGENSASRAYVRMKKKACNEIGIASIDYELSAQVKEEELLLLIDKLNKDLKVHGILIQLPLPPHLNTKKITYAIDPSKDVDGFHPFNLGKMLIGDTDSFYPCTPLGIKILMEKAEIPTEKKHVVICGRSNIVGKPLAALLVQNQKGCNATVTLTHSLTMNLPHYTREADILIVAVGKANFITKEMVKEGAVVIDVGINRINGNIVGDVAFNDLYPKVSKITPVPGGVGPMTIASLMSNTHKSYLFGSYKDII